jgi:class 3 adenylate cyclase
VRYLKVALICGALSALAVAGLCELRLFHPLDAALWNFLGRASRPPTLQRSVPQYVLFVLLSFAIAWTTIDIPRRSLKVVVAVGAFMQLITITWVLNLYHYFFSPFAGCLAIFLAFVSGFIYARSDAGRRKRVVRVMFGERISKKTFYALVNSDAPLNFEGEMREATVLVCEIFNHDQLMDNLPVGDYVAMTNSFLRSGADFLVEKGGYLDECDGESLRVIFGTPVLDKDHATKACQAALELVRRLDEVNRECESMWHERFDFRIGINSGEMVTAAYGSRRFGTFSVAGECVEFARRLCAANVFYGSKILLGSGAFELASSSIEVRPIELIRGRSDRSREEVYELLALKDVLSEEELIRRDLFWKGVVCYREQRWNEALDHFHSALTLNGADAPLAFYIRRIEHLRTGTPALEWESARFLRFT